MEFKVIKHHIYKNLYVIANNDVTGYVAIWRNKWSRIKIKGINKGIKNFNAKNISEIYMFESRQDAINAMEYVYGVIIMEKLVGV